MNIMRVWSHALFNNCSHSLFNNYVLYLLYLNNHLLKKKKKSGLSFKSSSGKLLEIVNSP